MQCRLPTPRAKLEIEKQEVQADAVGALAQGAVVSSVVKQGHVHFLNKVIHDLPASTSGRPEKTPNWEENLK